MALIACRHQSAISKLSLERIVSRQNSDGGWSTNLIEKTSDWSTFLAVIAIEICLATVKKGLPENAAAKALNAADTFILNSRADYYNDLGKIILWLWRGASYDYPRGFSWTPDTADWVEPTAYAMLSLKCRSKKPNGYETRCLEVAEQFLLKISCPNGGWNFGEHYPTGQVSVPDPISTSLALLALKGSQKISKIEAALNYLSTMNPEKQGAMSLAWSIIALDAWNVNSKSLTVKLADLYDRPFNLDEKILPVALAAIALDLSHYGNPFSTKAGSATQNTVTN